MRFLLPVLAIALFGTSSALAQTKPAQDPTPVKPPAPVPANQTPALQDNQRLKSPLVMRSPPTRTEMSNPLSPRRRTEMSNPRRRVLQHKQRFQPLIIPQCGMWG